MSAITSLGFSIWSRFDGSGTTRADRALRRLNRNVNNSSKGINVLSGRLSVMAVAAGTLAPALLPIANVALGATAGLVALGVTGGAALGVFGAAMSRGVTETQRMAKAHEKLSPEQATFIRNTKAMGASWNKLSFGAPLKVANTGVTALRFAIAKLPPVIEAVHPIAQKIAQDFVHWTSGSGLDRFIDAIIKHGVPALNALRRAGVDTLAALGVGFRGSLQFIKPITDIIEKGAAALRHWAEGGGFDRFFTKVKKDGPAVKELMRQLWGAIQNIGRVAQGAASKSLTLVTNMAKLIATMDPKTISAIGSALLLWKHPFAWMVFNIPGLSDLIVKFMAALKPVDIYAIAAAIGAVRLAFMLMNTALLTTPLGWLILGLIAVAAGLFLLATKTRFFQTAWNAIWNGIKIAFAAVMGFLHSKFAALVLLIGPLGWLVFMATHWRQLWNGIKIAFVVVANAITTAWRAVGRVMRTVYDHVIHAVVSAFRAVGRALAVAWRGVTAAIGVVWRALGKGIRTVYDRVIHPVFNAMRIALSALQRAWKAVSGAIGAIWRGLGSGIRGVYNRVIHPVFGAIHVALNVVWKAFGHVVDGIKKTWDRLKNIVKGPVKFFVNTVYNNGLRRAWNNTAGKIPGVPDLPKANLGFARGGHVRGPGGSMTDSIPARLSNGEFVVRAKAVKALGVGTLNKLNTMGSVGKVPRGRSNVQPGFALGGLVGFDIPNPFDLLKKAGGAALGALKWGIDVTKDIGGKALGLMFNPLKKMAGSVTKKFAGAGMVSTAVKENFFRAIPAMIKFAVGHMLDSSGGVNVGLALKWARSQAGKKYQWGGNGNPSWDCSGFMSAIESVIRGEKPHRRWATGAFPPGAPGWKRNLRSPFEIGITNAGVGHTAGTLAGVNVECRGGAGCIVGPNARGASNGMFTSRWGFTGALGGGGGGAAKQIARAMLGQFGWGQQQFPPLEALWQRESGWKTNARNPSSGAYGIPQALPASKMASAGSDWKTNPMTQIKWGLGYIKGRYGNPTIANAFQKSHNWYRRGGLVANSYDRGGYLPKGLSLAYNGTGRPERVGHDWGGTIEFHNCTFSGGRGDFENMVVKAVSEAKRKKRL